MTSDQFRQLADFWSERGDALSIYFQARQPCEAAQPGEQILAKEKLQEKLAANLGASCADRADLRRALEIVATMMKGKHCRTKAIFACKRQQRGERKDKGKRHGA